MVKDTLLASLSRFWILFDIFDLDNSTEFIPNRLVLRITLVLGLRTPYSLVRLGFGYSFDIFVLDNPTGFIPNRLVLRITPVLG